MRSQLEVTVEVIKESMRGVTSFLKFTYETGEDFPGGWLPTLDTSLKVASNNLTLYKYFEKPTTINTTILRVTAMAENPKIQSLSNDLVRRLLNTKEDLPREYRAEVIDNYGRKLLTSGYSYEQTVKILVNGAKGYVANVKRARLHGRKRVHRTAQESCEVRDRKKLLGKTSWYRDRKIRKNENEELGGGRMRSNMKSHQGAREGNLRTRAVIFVEQTPGVEMAKLLRELLQQLGATLGFR